MFENEFKNLQTCDSSFFIGQSYFFNNGAQLYLIFQPLYYTLKNLADTKEFILWRSKGLSTEKLTAPITADNSLYPSIEWYENSNFCLIFKASCLKQKKTTFTFPNTINYFYCL